MQTTILDKIVATKKIEIEQAQAAVPISELQAALSDAPPVRDFLLPLSASGSIKLIAEIKKASPSAGIIREDFDPVEIASVYETHGASCISVLTDETYFQGKLEFLTSIRKHVSLPLLRKDFILTRYQLLEARVAGADAVLLIAECLDDETLNHLVQETLQLGITPLVELYDPANLERVVQTGAKLIGVNNRNLHTFEVDLGHSIRVSAMVPAGTTFVSESGIRTREDVLRLEAANINAMLVGETLTRQDDIGTAVDTLLGSE